jgi:hypothetical protein
MSFPYEDLAGFKARTTMPSGDVDYLEQNSPGFIAQCIASESSWINGRLRKRYGNANVNINGYSGYGEGTNGPVGNSLPFGQTPPALIPAGTNPPRGLQMVGTPILGSLMIALAITTPGAIGTAVFKYTSNGGITYTTGLVPLIAPGVVPLVGTGMSLAVPTGAIWGADNQYAAATPVPEILLKWLNALVTLAAYRRRGFNPQDPAGALIVDAAVEAKKEVLEAADSTSGLIDIPVSEDLDSAVTTGGPLGTSDASPFSWQDRQAARGRYQQCQWFTQGSWSGIWGP